MKYQATCPDCSSVVVIRFNNSTECNEWLNRHAESTMHNPEVLKDA